jgi:hypothetical protein
MPQFVDALTFTGKTVATSTTAQALFGPDGSGALLLLPANAKTIILLNLDSTNAVYVQMFSTPQGPPAPTLTLLDSIVVPAGAALTLDVGPVGQRADPYITGQTTYIQAAAGTPNVNVTFVMSAGSLFV